MEKRGYLFLIYSALAVFATNFVNAYVGSSGYFGSFAAEDLSLVIIFFVFFFVINFAFSRFFRDAEGQPLKTAWIPSLALAIGATYGIWNTNLDFGNLISSIGIPRGILDIFLPLLIIIFLIFLIKKLGFSKMIFILGGGFLITGLMDIVYESEWFIIIGTILLIIGLLIKGGKKHLRNRREIKSAERQERGKSKAQRRLERKQKKKDARSFRKKRNKVERRIEKRTGRKEWAKKFRRGKRFVEKQKAKRER